MIRGYEIEYQVLGKRYSVFLQSQAAVDELAEKLRARERVFTVNEVTVSEETGKRCEMEKVVIHFQNQAVSHKADQLAQLRKYLRLSFAYTEKLGEITYHHYDCWGTK